MQKGRIERIRKGMGLQKKAMERTRKHMRPAKKGEGKAGIGFAEKGVGSAKGRGKAAEKREGLRKEKRREGENGGVSAKTGSRLGKKQRWKPGNMLYPLPAVLVTVADKKGRDNIFTVAWTGTVCTNPPMVYVSVRPERHSYHMIQETEEFAINLATKDLAYAVDYCGVKSGRDVDKFEALHLTRQEASEISVPLLADSPVNIECKVVECKRLG